MKSVNMAINNEHRFPFLLRCDAATSRMARSLGCGEFQHSHSGARIKRELIDVFRWRRHYAFVQI